MRGFLVALTALLIAPATAQAAPVLSGAHFEGLTRIVATSSEDLSGVSPAEVSISGGAITPSAVSATGTQLVVDLPASAFAHTTSVGTTIAARGSAPVAVARGGEPVANAHMLGSSQWTDNGWSTSLTDPSQNLYRFQDLTPNADGVRNLRMLVLFVQFPNRLATNSPAGWTTMQPYLDFVQPASAWWKTASYGQLDVQFVSPQATNGLGWITMDKNANLYTWDAQTHNMFAYSREAFQKAYDQLGIKADDYDEVLIMPARGSSGLPNGPGNINRDPTDGEQTNTNQVAYVDHDGKPHYVSTVITAGNDMFSWGYRWLNHEFGHTVGLPDLYMYSPTNVAGVRVNQFFWVGGWNIMGNIGGHAGDYSGIQKYKLRWVRDDQVDVVSQPGASTHAITPLETPGGTKIVVIRTGLSTAYVAELRTKLGVDGLDNRARYQGVLLYRINTSLWEQRDVNAELQVISKQYYNDPAVGGPLNKNGVWRPLNTSLTGLDSQAALWGPGDTFTDPATGVKIDFGDITHRNAADPANSPYTADDTATLTVTKTSSAALSQPVTLREAKLTSPTTLHVDTSVELQRRIVDSNAINNGHFVYVREESPIKPSDLVLTRADGSAVPVAGVTINPDSLDIALAPGTFPTAASSQGLKLATKAFYYFAAATPVPVSSQLLDVGASVPAQLSLSLGAPASFGTLTPGVAQEYTAQTTANVISTAGDAALSVSDPGHLTNGTFSLPEALRVEIAPASWTGPVSNANVAITFRQHVGATDALRTGSYSRTLTFTLSTTAP